MSERKKKRPELKIGGPHRAYPSSKTTKEAWWYANKGSVEVVVEHKSGVTAMARVRLSDILRRLRRERTRKAVGDE